MPSLTYRSLNNISSTDSCDIPALIEGNEEGYLPPHIYIWSRYSCWTKCLIGRMTCGGNLLRRAEYHTPTNDEFKDLSFTMKFQTFDAVMTEKVMTICYRTICCWWVCWNSCSCLWTILCKSSHFIKVKYTYI